MNLTIEAAFNRAAQSYDGLRRQLVPCFDDFYGATLDLVSEFAPGRARILDLGAGTGLLSALVAERLPDAHLVLTDLAEAMLDKARARFARHSAPVEFRVMSHLDLAEEGGYDVVMSALSIHHLEDDGKQAVYAAMARATRPGGLVVNADQVAGDTPEMEARYWTHWHEAVQRAGIPAEEIAAAIERQTLDRRTPLAPQLDWLRLAGLAQVECRYKNVSFAVMAGIRT
ncbi:tRNA (uridine-5-oxyacetic acid methyl ester) 34 synthase [Paramagnetospirillum magnetotacticum MS-1]|uniref:tRNA (Uridine-5-oxyacetic acid methyl ester) 34 synthase n=1 Tax=Paramagnetospirillum magnetotacticum MS-1 TaxID=272627 RepID=A0A0C2YX31_PARME|nr:class I SAM-dependent methyltransferase [Paramagnetospirillum magnetotacticum]KIL99245.1 tRNA (uridine-5-oxyacetic acid methyl ester) 34 synthase [Paramagnetospirillum magnetotacticum MS-1]